MGYDATQRDIKQIVEKKKVNVWVSYFTLRLHKKNEIGSWYRWRRVFTRVGHGDKCIYK